MRSPCRACRGIGKVAADNIPWSDPVTCETCDGEGTVEAMCSCCTSNPATIRRIGDHEFPEVCAECNAYIEACDAEAATYAA